MEFAYKPLVGFRSEKAAQIAAYFLNKSDGTLEKLALIKLIYATEQESIRVRNRPIIYDEYYSLKDGPICSNALNAINGDIDAEIWAKYIQKNDRRNVTLVKGSAADLDQLSKSDIKILEEVWSRLGGKTATQLRAWTHSPTNCPEYTEVTIGRIPISLDDMVRRHSDAHPRDILSEVMAYRRLEILLPRK
jgi:uncharacterized phage-associated protein